ncbi:hypothetical protein GSUB_14200 [Geoalkalibacter subterraneus]|uniref:Uncharacterized protein n=1 Tax=Geoalkalibacter subterraneus TaxID=483547 RepID=A0A0B5FH35_9BACT|nr:hypothetical protein GSUB_14200 [Geoalkalibacter subterraneus]
MDKARKGRDPVPDVVRDAATVKLLPTHPSPAAAAAAGWAVAPVPAREWARGRHCAADAVRHCGGGPTIWNKMENESS